MGSLVYEPPRSGPTLWEIGIPDRTAAEFYVPDASPQLVNKLFPELKPDRSVLPQHNHNTFGIPRFCGKPELEQVQ